MKYRIIVAALSFAVGGASAQSAYSAKSLFFAEDDTVVNASTASKPVTAAAASKVQPTNRPAATSLATRKPSNPTQIGASYFVRLKNQNGSNTDVLASRKFQSGERFQLGVKVNKPTYITILNEAPDGRITQIYPQPGKENFVDAMGTVFLPTQGSFEFDDKPGTEQLLVYISSTPSPPNVQDQIRRASPDIVTVPVSMLATNASCETQPTLNAAPAPDPHMVLASADAYASKGINFKEDSTATCATTSKVNLEAFASKGIVFTDDAAPAAGGQVASYVVKKVSTGTSSNSSLYLKIKLVHE